VTQVHCKDCTHYRSAPWQAKFEGCYHKEHLSQKQKVDYLDEQQLPGDHRLINRLHDCSEHEARQQEEPLWKRLMRA